MTQASKRHEMTTLAVWLFLTAIALVAWAVFSIHDKHAHTAVALIAWALIVVSPIPLFIWPTECKVINTRGKACMQTSFGFLFGCKRYYHWWPKFFARLGYRRSTLKQASQHQPTGNTTVMHQAALESEPIKVRVEDNALTVCGTWAGIISAATGVIGLIVGGH